MHLCNRSFTQLFIEKLILCQTSSESLAYHSVSLASLIKMLEAEVLQGLIFTWLIETWKKESEVAQSCPTLCDPMDYSLPDSSVHGIFQARILEWVATSFSRRSSRPRDWTRVFCIVGRHFPIWATREVLTWQVLSWDMTLYQLLLFRPFLLVNGASLVARMPARILIFDIH